VDAAGDEVVAGALRGGGGQDGRLDLREAALGQEIADELGDAGAEDDVAVDRLAAEVQVAVLEAQQLVDVRLLDDVEGRRLGLVEDGGGVGLHLDLARREVRVLRSLGPVGDGALHLEDVLAADRIGDGVGLAALFRVEHHLGEAVVVAQVDEDEAAVVATAVDPAGQRDRLPFVGGAQLAAVVALEHA